VPLNRVYGVSKRKKVLTIVDFPLHAAVHAAYSISWIRTRSKRNESRKGETIILNQEVSQPMAVFELEVKKG
jgi:hypothetical protein